MGNNRKSIFGYTWNDLPHTRKFLHGLFHPVFKESTTNERGHVIRDREVATEERIEQISRAGKSEIDWS